MIFTQQVGNDDCQSALEFLYCFSFSCEPNPVPGGRHPDPGLVIPKCIDDNLHKEYSTAAGNL